MRKAAELRGILVELYARLLCTIYGICYAREHAGAGGISIRGSGTGEVHASPCVASVPPTAPRPPLTWPHSGAGMAVSIAIKIMEQST